MPDINLFTGSPLYQIDEASLKRLQKYIWSTDIVDVIDKYIYNPKEAIISLRLCDFALNKQSSTNLIIGNKITDIVVTKISNWVQLNLGSVRLNEYYGMYLDYMPTMSAKIYLPHFGYVNVTIDDVMNCSINIIYKIELYSGSCIIEIYSHNKRFNTDILIEQCSTSILMTVPLTFSDKNNVINETISSLTHATNVSGAVSTIESAIDIATNKQTFTNVSKATNAFGILSYNQAFIKLERQVAAVSSSYLKEKGFPLMATTRLSKLKGFTKVYSIEHLSIADITEEEYNELESILKDGVIL